MLCLCGVNGFNFTNIPEYKTTNIELNDNNFVAIREVVTDASIKKGVAALMTNIITNPYLKEYYLVLDTPGGSVVAGNQLIDYLNYLNNTDIKVHCIAKTAISMGFVILQSCPGIRYALPSATLMQHQMSTVMIGNILNIESDMKFSKRLYEKMLIKQSSRIGIEPSTFLDKTRDDWWLDGEMALENNIVDKLVNVGCSQDVLKKLITIEKHSMFGSTKVSVNKCPIL
jgi:ATP-dependent protease ClpP protease subunit